jgi:hypothetical protein
MPVSKETELKLKLNELNSFSVNRQLGYGLIEGQLNLLYDDIKNGLFGDAAKSGAWFTHITEIKSQHPKPNLDEVKADIERLITEVDVSKMFPDITDPT